MEILPRRTCCRLDVSPSLRRHSLARGVYFNLTEDEIVLLVTVYVKADRENILAKEIKRKRSKA